MTTDREDGALSLELALTVPVVFVLLVLVGHGAVLARDALLVQGAAREAARVAASTGDEAAARGAAREAVDGREVVVVIDGTGRAGGLVRVSVSMRSAAGRGATRVRASAAAAVEPGSVRAR